MEFSDRLLEGFIHLDLMAGCIADLFAGKKPDIPWIDTTVFMKAKREEEGTSKQTSMDL